jgi:translation initiation factor 2 alpha subunit (eIF-2alpha)
MKELEEGQIVLCTVDRISGTIVFVKIDDYGTEGIITFSEISPGRIRNIRDYVFPGKKIVCKVLRIRPQGIDLSLRRVKLKEKNELNEVYRKEKSFKALLRTAIKEKADAEKIINEIKEKEGSIADFLEEVKKEPNLIEKYLPANSVEKIVKVIQEKKVKEAILIRRFLLSSKDPKGISIVNTIIKQAIKDAECTDCKTSYIAAGKYLIKIKTRDPKQTDTNLNKIIKNIEDLAKQKSCEFSLEK